MFQAVNKKLLFCFSSQETLLTELSKMIDNKSRTSDSFIVILSGTSVTNESVTNVSDAAQVLLHSYKLRRNFFWRSYGIDLPILICRCPQTFKI